MAKVTNGTLTIIATRYGDSHAVTIALDKLQGLCSQLAAVGKENGNPLVS